MVRYFNIEIMIQDHKDITVESSLISFQEEEVCPKTCCKEDLCFITDNFNVNYEFVDAYTFDA